MIGRSAPTGARRPRRTAPDRTLRRARRARRRLLASASRPDERPIITSRPARAALALLTCAYAAGMSYLTVRNHHGFATFGFDLGIFDQGIWLLSRGETPFVTVRGLHLFGDHQSLVLLLLVPAYWVLPSPSLLLVVQSVALAAGALATFALARRALRAEWPATACAAAYLAHPAVGWTSFDNFHPDAFQVPLVLSAFAFAHAGRWRWFLACVALLLLTKEDVPLLTFFLGLLVARRYHLRVGLLTSAVSAAWLALALLVVLPAFRDGGSLYTGRVTDRFGGIGGLVQTGVTQPWELAAVAVEGDRAWYLWQLVVSFALLSLLAPAVLLVAAATLAAHLLSSFGYQHEIRYHYSTLVVPVLTAAAVLGIARFRSRKVRAALALGMAVAAVSSALLWGPFGRQPAYLADPGSPHARSARLALSMVPPAAAVAAGPSYVPHLTHRSQVYEFPNPWRATNWGDFTQEGMSLPSADDVEYVLVNAPTLNDVETGVLRHLERSGFRRVLDANGVRLLERAPDAGEAW